MRIRFPLLAALLMFMLSCNQSDVQEDKRIISVSILPQKYFVETIAGDEFDVNVMLPPGTSPASYDPTPKQLRDISKSGIYLKMGHLGFEDAWMDAIQKNHRDLKITDLSAGIDLIQGAHQEEGMKEHEDHGHDHDHGGIDPHIWMSPKQALRIAENTANAIIRYEPACKDLIRSNLDSLKNIILNLDREMTEAVQKLTNRKFIIYHPALTYLARDYGLEQLSMEFEGKEPTVANMKNLVDRAKSENIKVVFIQKEFDQERARQISKDIGAKLIQIDPLAEDWAKQMKQVIDSFK
jgi:zinc transport system substrate-binding protein